MKKLETEIDQIKQPSLAPPSGKKSAASGDTGLLSALPPDWRKEFLDNKRLTLARIPLKFAGKSFDNFSTARSQQRKTVLQVTRSYAESFNFNAGPPSGLILKGDVGCGKTHLAVAILQHVLRKGYTGLYYNMVDLLSEIRDTFNPNTAQSEHEFLDELNEPDLLVLDDLGAEKTTEFVNDRLYLIINRRYECCRPILVTTNLSMDELADKMGKRSVSRLHEMTHLIDTFPNEDYRKSHMKN